MYKIWWIFTFCFNIFLYCFTFPIIKFIKLLIFFFKNIKDRFLSLKKIGKQLCLWIKSNFNVLFWNGLILILIVLLYPTYLNFYEDQTKTIYEFLEKNIWLYNEVFQITYQAKHTYGWLKPFQPNLWMQVVLYDFPEFVIEINERVTFYNNLTRKLNDLMESVYTILVSPPYTEVDLSKLQFLKQECLSNQQLVKHIIFSKKHLWKEMLPREICYTNYPLTLWSLHQYIKPFGDIEFLFYVTHCAGFPYYLKEKLFFVELLFFYTDVLGWYAEILDQKIQFLELEGLRRENYILNRHVF